MVTADQLLRQTVFVTPEERSAAEDICNATKEEILRRAGEKLLLHSDEETRDVLQNKLDHLQKILRSKKDHLLSFYVEIIILLEHADALETVRQNVEIDEGDN